MSSVLPPTKRHVVEALVGALAELPGIAALALGGSWARGSARPDSDVDLGIYYRDAGPFDVEDVRAVAARFDPRPERVVSERGEWGPWVDGGAWLRVAGETVDLLYRSLDLLDRTLEECRRGVTHWHAGQQPVYGFRSPMLLAELHACVPLHDPAAELARRKPAVAEPPEALRREVLRSELRGAALDLEHARGFAGRGEVVHTAGCLTRLAGRLVQARYAELGRWYAGEKGALEALESTARSELEEVLASPGSDAAALLLSVERVAALVEETEVRCGVTAGQELRRSLAARRGPA